jgi:hypothetical protein
MSEQCVPALQFLQEQSTGAGERIAQNRKVSLKFAA